jgi:propanediol dehydratase large subunit
MPAGGRVLELRRDDERERNCFFNLATTAQLGYYYQRCPQERSQDRVHMANVIVDPNVLRENLRLMLKDE